MRLDRYSRLSTKLAYLDDVELRALVGDAVAPPRAWGESQVAKLDDELVFVKRIPLTDLERARMFSTRNHFRIPTYYSYGVGSAGFGAFRELAAHVKTTNWVLQGAFDGFPLLYHARVLPRAHRAGRRRTEGLAGGAEDMEKYARRWNNSKNIMRYVEARQSASHDIWLILEHQPHAMANWLPENPARVGDAIRQVCEAVTFLRSRGVVHFDAHTGNMIGDGENVHLTDFGLLLDAEFQLTTTERDFLARHSHYDYGLAIAALGWSVLGDAFRRAEPETQAAIRERYGIDPNPNRGLVTLVEKVEELHAREELPLEASYVATAARYSAVIAFVYRFLGELSSNPRKNTFFDDAELRRLLESTGLPLE